MTFAFLKVSSAGGGILLLNSVTDKIFVINRRIGEEKHPWIV